MPSLLAPTQTPLVLFKGSLPLLIDNYLLMIHRTLCIVRLGIYVVMMHIIMY